MELSWLLSHSLTNEIKSSVVVSPVTSLELETEPVLYVVWLISPFPPPPPILYHFCA